MSNIPRKKVVLFTSKNIKPFISRNIGLNLIVLYLMIFFIFFSNVESKKNIVNQGYNEFIIKERKEKDEFFKNDKDSPLLELTKMKFKGLNYYPPDLSFKFRARLILFDKNDTIDMLTTKNDFRKMIRYGKLEFIYSKKIYYLTAYLPIKNQEYFFVPFTDKTNNKTTYAGGRYLDIERKNMTDVYDLDFNLAYNPYCAYNPKYSCPIVPKENQLKISIKAGEKIFKLK